MQKKLKSLVMLAAIVAAAAIVFIACGDGDMLDISVVEKEVDSAKDVVVDDIGDPDSEIWNQPDLPSSSSEYIEPEPSSSSEQTPSSSQQQTQSSSQQQTQSSSQQQTQSSSSKPAASSSSKPAASSSSKPPPAGGCGENNPKSGFTCKWNVEGTLTPGTVLKPVGTLPSGCSSIAWKYAADTSSIELLLGCESTDADGFEALGSQNYVLFGELTCDDGKHTTACNPKTGLSSKIAPTLKGKCAWDRDPPVTTSGKGAKPSGVTVSDPDNVCGSTKSVVYKYADGTKNWNLTTGILSEWDTGVWKTDKKHKETYSDVTPTLNCPAYSQTITEEACAPLEVSAGADYTIELDCSGVGNDGLDKCKGKNEAVLSPDKSCVEMYVINYTGDPRPAVVECNVDGNGGAADVTLKGTTHKLTGYYGYFDLGNFKSGENEFGTLCLTSTESVTVKCNISKR